MSQEFSRRSFFGLAAAGAAASMTSLPSGSFASGPRKRQVKNIIWMVSDGMSMGVPSMADHYLQLAHGRRSVWRKLRTDPKAVHGLMDTRSLNSMVTDSAAASSSWGSGVHVLNGAINTLPGVPELTTLYDLFGKIGMKRGLVTTTTITHATPSGFAVAVRSRSAEPVIAGLYKEKQIDVLMGGGEEFFSPSTRGDKKDLFAEYSQAGYQVCRTKEELKKASSSGRILGVFGKGQLPYTIDRIHTPELDAKVPTLAEMASKALNLLKGSSEGFILQVEGGRVDHAAHANDLGAILHDQLDFEEALRVCLDFAREDGETLLVVTSDHGNANPGLTGASEIGAKNGLLLVPQMTASYEALSDSLKKAATGPAMKDLVAAKLGVTLSAEDADLVAKSFASTPLRLTGNYRHATAILSVALSSATGVGWTSGSHTSDYTLLTSYGPGAELFAGAVANVDCFGKLLSLRGISHRNPTLTLEEAQAAAAKEASIHPSLAAEVVLDPQAEGAWA